MKIGTMGTPDTIDVLLNRATVRQIGRLPQSDSLGG